MAGMVVFGHRVEFFQFGYEPPDLVQVFVIPAVEDVNRPFPLADIEFDADGLIYNGRDQPVMMFPARHGIG